MRIEEILKQAGIEDEEAISKVAAEVPKHFVPSDEMSKRVNAAKKEASEAAEQLEAYKAEVAKAAEDAAKKAADEGSANEQELASLKEQLEKLQGEYSASQTKLKETRAADALRSAIKAAGANPAAVELLVNANLGGVTYGEDDLPSNVSELVEAVKSGNEGLFGVDVDTGKQSGNGDAGAAGISDDFLAGFGEVKPRR